MRKRNLGIYIMTAALAAIVCFLCIRELKTGDPFWFEAVTEEGTQTVRVWESPGEEYIVFLPSYVNLNQLRLRTMGRSPIWLDDIKLSDGMSCEALQTDRPYELSYGYGYMTMVTFLQSADVPALFMETASGAMDHIHREKGNAEGGAMQLYTADGRLDHRGNLLSIKSRGNSTFSSDKKPYSLELAAEGDLLGMGAARKWVLLSNPNDTSHIRNKIVYDFAQAVGMPYSPQCQWVDLYLNGEYAGLYLLCERNEVHPQRVDIAGGFLVSAEFSFRPLDHPYIETRRGTRIRIHQSALTEEALLELWQSVENALYAPDGVDPGTGKHWSDLIDLDSWARKYLIEEIFANVDGGRASAFFYLENGKICAGPVWDYDYALSNPITYMELEENVRYRDSFFQTYLVNSTPESFFYPLYRDDLFRSRVEALYQQEFRPLLQTLCRTGAYGYAGQISQAANMNAVRWNVRDTDEQVALIQSCIDGREAFLTSLWVDHRDYVNVWARYGTRVMGYAIAPGGRLPELPQFETYDWCYADTDVPVDWARPVEGETHIYLRSKSQ